MSSAIFLTSVSNIDPLRNISETFAPINAERTESILHNIMLRVCLTSLQSQDSDWIC